MKGRHRSFDGASASSDGPAHQKKICGVLITRSCSTRRSSRISGIFDVDTLLTHNYIYYTNSSANGNADGHKWYGLPVFYPCIYSAVSTAVYTRIYSPCFPDTCIWEIEDWDVTKNPSVERLTPLPTEYIVRIILTRLSRCLALRGFRLLIAACVARLACLPASLPPCLPA